MDAGDKFPQFSLPNQDGKTIKLSEYAGKWVILYVYPKDDTKNCTIQAKAFTANKADFDKAGVAVLGLSPDDVGSHKNFCQKFALNIDLLADPKFELLSAIGVGQTAWEGVDYWNRTTFIIDPKGIVARRYDKVQAEGHDQVLLDDVTKLQEEFKAVSR